MEDEAIHSAGAARNNDPWTKCIREVPRCFTQTQQEQLCSASRLSSQDPAAPGQCATLALGGRPLQSPKFASRVELLRAASIIQLCSGTENSGPGKCWIAMPTQYRQQMLVAASSNTELDWNFEVASTPLIRVCQHAHDDRPATCLLQWFEISKTLSKRDAHDALEVSVALCKAFSGQVTALQQCVKRTIPHLRYGAGSEIGVFQLCRFIGDGTNLPALVECASKLGRKHVLPRTIAQVCAGISGGVQPHVCYLEAQQKLRWMDQDAQISLCKDAEAHTATEPINCASRMKSTVRPLLLSKLLSSPTAEFNVFVSNLCRSATNTTTLLECLRLLPAHTFTASQALRLCAASTMPARTHEDEEFVSLYPTSCATQARLLLRRSLSMPVAGSNDHGMSASAAAVHVCEQAMSDAPSKCLSDTQHDRVLSTILRVQLCQRATSDSPQRCVRSLRKFINAQRIDVNDVVMACRQTESLGPAECVTELLQVGTSVSGKVAAQLCYAAKSLDRARCFMAAPAFYDDELKVSLCSQAESLAPVSCVESAITRFANHPSIKVALCRGATSSAPATCAIEAPFGMGETNVITLCRSAVSIAPAICAQEVPPSLRIPWHHVAQVCSGATSTTPGRCLAHHIRHSRVLLHALDDEQIVNDCRQEVARPAALGIAQASYNCPELRPMCPLHVVLNVLDQYGDRVVEDYPRVPGTNVVFVSVVFTGRHDKEYEHSHRGQPALQGPSYAIISNGTAVFSNLLFTGAGEFTLTFHAGEGVTEEVARVLVHPDHAAEALQVRCDELFTHFQCSAQSPPALKRDYQHNALQTLLLSREFHLNAISCGQHWIDNIGGLVFSGFSSPNLLYILPRPLYDLFTSTDVPHVDMSAYALLGLNEGESNRAAIRRAYHQRSLEWHPDKWHAVAATLSPSWQQKLDGIYALVTQAYDQLVKPAQLQHA